MKLTAVLTFLLTLVPQAVAEQAHGIALYGAPKQPPGFTHFSYVNPEAPKGGRLVLGAFGLVRQPQPAHRQRHRGQRHPRFHHREPDGAQARRAVHALWACRRDRRGAEDRSSITFHLNPKAHFSDGKPITADDVLFSLELLKRKGRPNHRTYFAKVVKAERLSDRSVRFTFDATGDREIPLILGLMPVLPKHAINPDTYENTSLEAPVGSGPYRVGKIDAGRSITFVRDENYWGRDLPVNRGRFNFDEIRFDYFREGSVMFDAFKSGQIDLWPEEDPRRWANGYDFPAIRDGRAVKREFDIGLPAGMTALVFNTRRQVFAEPRVREALIYLFDFEWINRTLYRRALPTHAKLLRALDPRFGRAAGGCARARAAGAIPGRREAGLHGG